MSTPRTLIASVAFIAVLLAGSPAYASVRLEDAGADLPFYARPLAGTEWTAIIFYRSPACVPDTFDLWAFFDIPGAFDCGPATTDGFAVWKNGPGVDFAPLQLVLNGMGAVPIYFVRTDEYDAATLDGVLTMAEVEAMPSLIVGVATDYHEVLHPDEGAKVGKIAVVASGTLEDGRSFRLHVSSVNRHEKVQVVFR